MRARLLALTICLVGWASSPVAALLVSVHILEHESDAPSHSLDPRFAASHGHHHELDVPDHSHEMISASETPSLESPFKWPGVNDLSTGESGALYSRPIPVALPPPRHQALCVMLL